ncbi:MAG: DUF1697 domain-containing protein [Candidatus Margulisbacteria bacterium]|nr:DUF1697 domain-containing protein [Candidatus Margulisiibacteriota bacterium]
MSSDQKKETLISYVALLRGINVGGKNIIKMEVLREEFVKMGFLSVKTYIQSGNVLFQSDMTNKDDIERKIEKQLASRFQYQAKVLIRSKEDLQNSISHFPKIFENPDWKHNVIFLSNTIDSEMIVQKFKIKQEIESISYYQGVLFWSAAKNTLTRSTMLKLSTHPEYQEMTVRNVNTTKKILDLMN